MDIGKKYNFTICISGSKIGTDGKNVETQEKTLLGTYA